MAETSVPTTPDRSPRAVGRRVAFAVYYGIAVAVGGACAVQITRQVFFVSTPTPPYASCHDGLRALFDAVARAREAAAGAGGERTRRSPGSAARSSPNGRTGTEWRHSA